MADASKRIDLAAPLLSVRRHGQAGAGMQYGRRNDGGTLGGVPFGWEHWPGRPKSVRTIIRLAPPHPEPEEAARSSDTLSRADSCYTVNCSVTGLSDAAGASATVVSPGDSGGSVMMDRFLLAAKEQCTFRKTGVAPAAVKVRAVDGDSLPRRLPVQHLPMSHAQSTYVKDTNEDHGGEDEQDAHSTAGFASRRKCGLLPTRCARILNAAHAIGSRRRRGARRFLSELGKSCQRETHPLLPQRQRRPGHDAGMRTWEEVHMSSLMRLVRSDRACSLRQGATMASGLDRTARGLYSGQAGAAVHPKATNLGLLLVLDRTDGGGAASPLPSQKRGRTPSGVKTSSRRDAIGHGFPPILEEKTSASSDDDIVLTRAHPPVLLALPSPKMPTESWLWRTLPSVSTKPPVTSFLGIHVQQLRAKMQAPSPCRSSDQAKVADHGARPRRVRIHDLHK